MNDFYESVYSQDNPATEPHGWIQWKGTEVCMDLYCTCGYHGHVDADENRTVTLGSAATAPKEAK